MFGTKHSKILKLIAKDHQIRNKWTEYKILELKYENTKLLGNTKYNPIKYLQFLFLLLCSKLALNYTKQAWYN